MTKLNILPNVEQRQREIQLPTMTKEICHKKNVQNFLIISNISTCIVPEIATELMLGKYITTNAGCIKCERLLNSRLRRQTIIIVECLPECFMDIIICAEIV